MLASSSCQLGSFLIGVARDDGVEVLLEGIDGWDSPSGTLSVTQKPRSFGGWAGRSYLTPRDITIKGSITGPSTEVVSAVIDELIAACTLGPTTLTVDEASRSRFATVRRNGKVLAPWTSDTSADFSVQLVAPDPLRYAALSPVSTGLPVTTGGLTFPVTFPITFTGSTATGVVRLVNAGNETAPLLFRIDGPVVAPSITHITTGNQVVFSTDLTLGAGEFLTVDMANRAVLAQGQSSRSGDLVSRGWFNLLPGANDFQFQASVYSAGALLTASSFSAWS